MRKQMSCLENKYIWLIIGCKKKKKTEVGLLRTVHWNTPWTKCVCPESVHLRCARFACVQCVCVCVCVCACVYVCASVSEEASSSLTVIDGCPGKLLIASDKGSLKINKEHTHTHTHTHTTSVYVHVCIIHWYVLTTWVDTDGSGMSFLTHDLPYVQLSPGDCKCDIIFYTHYKIQWAVLPFVKWWFAARFLLGFSEIKSWLWCSLSW